MANTHKGAVQDGAAAHALLVNRRLLERGTTLMCECSNFDHSHDPLLCSGYPGLTVAEKGYHRPMCVPCAGVTP